MIAVSGAFVLAALVLLVIGLATNGLTVVYASILASVVSAAFLVAGVLQLHRQHAVADGDGLPGGWSPVRDDDEDDELESAPGSAGGGPAPGPPRPAGGPLPPVGVGTATAGIVFVVEGSPHYHAADCARLAGGTPEPLEVEDAQDTGYPPCPACRPDETLSRLARLPHGGVGADGAELIRPDDREAGSTAGLGHAASQSAAAPASAVEEAVLAVTAQGRYHRPGCSYLPAGARVLTRRGAAEEQGLRPCPLCANENA